MWLPPRPFLGPSSSLGQTQPEWQARPGGYCGRAGARCAEWHPVPVSPTDVSTIVSREEWGAGAVGCNTPLTMPVGFLVIHHVPGLECHSRTSCSQRLRELRAHHMHNSWCDVTYK